MRKLKLYLILLLILISINITNADMENYYIPYGKELLGISQTEKYHFFLNNQNYLYNLKNSLYIDTELLETDVLKYLEFLTINIPELKEQYSKPTEKYFIKSEHGHSDNFFSILDNKKYNVGLKGITTSVSYQGYFSEYGTVNIISIVDTENKEMFFATFIHENLHTLQKSKYGNPMYDIYSADVKKLSIKELRAGLEVVYQEIEAHKKTADLIGNILNQQKEKKEYVLSYLGLTEQGLVKEKNNELDKYSQYIRMEKQMMNEIMGRNNA